MKSAPDKIVTSLEAVQHPLHHSAKFLKRLLICELVYTYYGSHMVYSSSKGGLNKRWAEMQRQFGASQRKIIDYIKTSQIPGKSEWAGYRTKLYRNFGFRITIIGSAHLLLSLSTN